MALKETEKQYEFKKFHLNFYKLFFVAQLREQLAHSQRKRGSEFKSHLVFIFPLHCSLFT